MYAPAPAPQHNTLKAVPRSVISQKANTVVPHKHSLDAKDNSASGNVACFISSVWSALR